MGSVIKKLQGITTLIAERSEVLVIFIVIGIIFMMILPLPTGLVDALIALNISVSALMVVLAMYMPGPLAFATFPALLLVTTLFRMALSITTTRLILLQGDAGQIVEAFGEFVVGGNLVVGLVIFLILTIVNFLVITKGSERVAEVAARFTLDAMPGKQMSIDGDLRAGLLDARTAQKKRSDIGRESQLFGAMDGAMKFVKGDAIAGIIIVMVNILGGFSIGVMQLGLPAGEAIQVYAILTIGDGLVAQIPALLISITAGFIITRVSDSTAEETNVGREMASELASEPKAWIIASFVMICFSLVPGMPFFAFICFALLFGTGGVYQIYLKYQTASKTAKASIEEARKLAEPPKEDETDLRTFTPFDKLNFVAKDVSPNNALAQTALKTIRRARNKIVTEKGYTIPGIEVISEAELDDNVFQLRVYGVPVLCGSLEEERLAINADHCDENMQKALEGIGAKRGSEVATEKNIFWVSAEKEEEVKSKNIPYMHSSDFFFQKASNTILRNSPQFIGVEEAGKILAWLGADSAQLTQELQRVVTVSKFSEILQGLAKDGVSIRSIRRICEYIVDKSATERTVSGIVEALRIELREQICAEAAHLNTLNVYIFEPETEERIRKSVRKTNAGDFIELPMDERRTLIDVIASQAQQEEHKSGAVIIAQDLRSALRNFIKKDLFETPVLSPVELSDSINIIPKARLSL